MGACDFSTTATAKTAAEAFRTARDDALHEYGHRSYTGTISEKSSFVEARLPSIAKMARKNRLPTAYAVVSALFDLAIYAEQVRAHRDDVRDAARYGRKPRKAPKAPRIPAAIRRLVNSLPSRVVREINDKWGAAVAIDCGLVEGSSVRRLYLFAGMASC